MAVVPNKRHGFFFDVGTRHSDSLHEATDGRLPVLVDGPGGLPLALGMTVVEAVFGREAERQMTQPLLERLVVAATHYND